MTDSEQVLQFQVVEGTRTISIAYSYDYDEKEQMILVRYGASIHRPKDIPFFDQCHCDEHKPKSKSTVTRTSMAEHAMVRYTHSPLRVQVQLNGGCRDRIIKLSEQLDRKLFAVKIDDYINRMRSSVSTYIDNIKYTSELMIAKYRANRKVAPCNVLQESMSFTHPKPPQDRVPITDVDDNTAEAVARAIARHSMFSYGAYSSKACKGIVRLYNPT